MKQKLMAIMQIMKNTKKLQVQLYIFRKNHNDGDVHKHTIYKICNELFLDFYIHHNSNKKFSIFLLFKSIMLVKILNLQYLDLEIEP